MQPERALIPVVSLEARVLVAANRTERRRDLPVRAAFADLHMRRLAVALDRRVRIVRVQRHIADCIAGADAESALLVDRKRGARIEIGNRTGGRINADCRPTEEGARADHRVRIECVDAEWIVQLRVRHPHRERTVRVVCAQAVSTVLMEVARDATERIQAAKGKAREVIREELHRVRQAVAVEAIEVALVDRITAAPCRDVVDRHHLIGQIELIAERQRAPLVLQADIRLSAKFSAAEGQISRAEVKAAFKDEHRRQSTTQIFVTLEAKAIAIRDAIVELLDVRAPGIADIGDARIHNPIQRDAALGLTDGGDAGEREGYAGQCCGTLSFHCVVLSCLCRWEERSAQTAAERPELAGMTRRLWSARRVFARNQSDDDGTVQAHISGNSTTGDADWSDCDNEGKC